MKANNLEGLVILPSEVSHIAEVAKIMRKADVEEVMASGNYTPTEALRAAFFASDFCSTAFLFGHFAGMFGVLSHNNTPVGWLLTTDYVDEYPFLFYKSCKEVIQDLLKTYHLLVNMIDARHVRALRWARGLGFSVGPEVPFGPNRMLFRRVEIRRGACANRSRLALLQA